MHTCYIIEDMNGKPVRTNCVIYRTKETAIATAKRLTNEWGDLVVREVIGQDTDAGLNYEGYPLDINHIIAMGPIVGNNWDE